MSVFNYSDLFWVKFGNMATFSFLQDITWHGRFARLDTGG